MYLQWQRRVVKGRFRSYGASSVAKMCGKCIFSGENNYVRNLSSLAEMCRKCTCIFSGFSTCYSLNQWLELRHDAHRRCRSLTDLRPLTTSIESKAEHFLEKRDIRQLQRDNIIDCLLNPVTLLLLY